MDFFIPLSFAPDGCTRTWSSHRATVNGWPTPRVTWSKNGRALPDSPRYHARYDPASGAITLVIQRLGPGDEGDYTCKAENPYGEVAATLRVDPEGRGIRRRALSPHCARMKLQQC